MAIDYPDWTGQVGALHTTNNIVTLSGAAITGYRTFEAAVTASKLTDANQVYVLIEESDTKKALWLATFDDEATDTLTMNTLIDSIGTFTAGEATAVEAIVVGPGAMLKAIDVAQIDLDGATDIGAALADADLILVDDGAVGTNRKSAMSRVRNYIDIVAGAIRGCGVSFSSTTAIAISAGEIVVNGAVYTPSAATLTSGSTMLDIAGNTVTLGNSKGYWVFAYVTGGAVAFRVEDIDGTGDGADVVWDATAQYWKSATTGLDARRIGKFWTLSTGAIAKFYIAQSGRTIKCSVENTADYLLVSSGAETSYTALTPTPYMTASDIEIGLGPQIERGSGTADVLLFISLDSGTSYHGRIAQRDGASSTLRVSLRPVWMPYAGTLHYKVEGTAAVGTILLLGYAMTI